MASDAVPTSAAEPFWTRRRRLLWTGYGSVAAACIFLGSIQEWRDSHAFLINATTSLPNWAFVLETKRLPARGEYVFFAPPKSGLIRRHFGPSPMFGKIAYGVGGDIVTRQDRTYFVNGRQVAVAKEKSRFGEPLSLGPTGVIPKGCFFVGSPHKDGFDSRYGQIGWICAGRIVGVGAPVL